MLYFIDTHAHLYLPEFDSDRDKVVETAIQRGVKKIFLPNIDVATVGKMNAIADKFPGVCYPMIGLHPTSVKENYAEELAVITDELEKGVYYGIGETGIDLYWSKTFFIEQCLAFTSQLDLSVKKRLPVIIHARESFNEILEILEGYRYKGLTGIFHAFTGSSEMAGKVTDMGFKLGIGGIVTYKNSTLPEIIRETDLTHIVLETDSPYLAPVPQRGKRNECSYVTYIAEFISKIKNVSLETVASITTANALDLLNPDSK